MRTDVVIIGAGHNGLVCAAYLAKAGFRVTIVVIKELGLKLPLLPRRPSSFTPVLDAHGGLILGWGDSGKDAEEIARYSTRDAKAYAKYEHMVAHLANLIDPILDIDAGDLRSTRNALVYGKALARFLGSGREALAMGSLLLGSARNQLSSWFESEPLRSTLATDALIGTFAGPSTPGTGYVLVHHMMGGGSWYYVKGGMGTISEALKTKAEHYGATVLLNMRVTRVDADARTVILENGRTIEYTKAIVSNLNPMSTAKLFGDVGESKQRFTQDVSSIDFRSPVVKINMALDSLPTFARTKDASRPGPEHMGTIHLGATSLDDLDASFQDAERGELPRTPMIEMTIPSAVDPTLAPPGKHVCSLFVQHVPPSLSNAFWNEHRDSFADRCIAQVEKVSPGFSRRILHREVLAPPDLERIFGLTGGNIFHGAMTLDRLLHARPVNAYFHPSLGSSYATPWANVFLCSAGTHPGGGVMGACGRNAAMAIVKRMLK